MATQEKTDRRFQAGPIIADSPPWRKLILRSGGVYLVFFLGVTEYMLGILSRDLTIVLSFDWGDRIASGFT
jgi:hypothetical protein